MVRGPSEMLELVVELNTNFKFATSSKALARKNAAACIGFMRGAIILS